MKACFSWDRRRQRSPGLPGEGLQADEEEEAAAAAKAEGARPATGDGPSPAAPPLGALAEELEAARDWQRLHVRERRKDVRSCRGCLRSAGALEQQLEALRDRLARAEARAGLPPPRHPRRRLPRDDDDDDEEEEEGAGGP